MGVSLGVMDIDLAAACDTSMVVPPASTEAPPRARGSTLVVNVDPATLDADTLQARALDESKKTLAARPRPLGSEDEIRVRIEGQTFEYRILVELRRRGVALARQPEPSSCECSSTELLQAVVTAVDESARRLEEAAAIELQAVAATTAEQGPAEPVGPAEPEPRVRPERSDRLWLAGVVLTSVGAASSVVGLTMALVRPQPVEPYFYRDWHAPGYALLGVGAAGLVGGVTMVVIDQLLCRRRGRCRSKGARAGGLAWAG